MSLRGRDVATGRVCEIAFADGLIASLQNVESDETLWIAPGLVDLQVNGFAGFDVNAGDVSMETVKALARQMLLRGVTTFLPTVITGSEERICRALRVIAEARAMDDVCAATIPSVHVEGPSISPMDGYRGAHPLEHVRPPSVEEFDRWQSAGDGLVGLVTLSPHWDETAEYVRYVVGRGARVSLGHTHANAEQIRVAVDAGASLSTHLGNGLPVMMERHRNPIWPQVADKRLTVMLIADGHHLPADVLAALVNTRDDDGTIFVSDAVALGGMPPGRYTAPIGGDVTLSEDGRLSMTGSPLLAGAARPLVDCIGPAMRATGLSLGEVLRRMTVNPGRFAGGAGGWGVGARGDAIRFGWDDDAMTAKVVDVWLRGQNVVREGALVV
jgi:N-acetylglucosamine-6-phosphate deacetylase